MTHRPGAVRQVSLSRFPKLGRYWRRHHCFRRANAIDAKSANNKTAVPHVAATLTPAMSACIPHSGGDFVKKIAPGKPANSMTKMAGMKDNTHLWPAQILQRLRRSRQRSQTAMGR